MDETGFTGEDRKTLITVDVSLRHVGDLLSSVTDRMVIVEKEYVHREELRAVEIDIDELRVGKADKVDLRHVESSRLAILDHLTNRVTKMEHNIEALIRWRWFERGIVFTIFVAGEIYSKFNK